MRGHPEGRRRRSSLRAACVVLSALVPPPPVAGAPMAAGPLQGLHRVVEDGPERLVLEIPVPPLETDSNRVGCRGCLRATVPGAPDLPEWRFLVATGPDAPSLSFSVSGGETALEIHGGVAPVPHAPTPRRLEHRPDPVLYAAASSLRPLILEPRLFRGAVVREVVVPLARLEAGGVRVLSPGLITVTVTFRPPHAAPGAGPDPLVQSAVANPAGAVRLAARRPSRGPARPRRQGIVGTPSASHRAVGPGRGLRPHPHRG